MRHAARVHPGLYFLFSPLLLPLLTLSVQMRTTLLSSTTTRSTHLRLGSLSLFICFLTIASKAMSGVNNPTLIPIYTKRLFSTNLIQVFLIFYIVKMDRKNRDVALKYFTMYIPNSESDFSPEFFLVEFHLDNLERETLVEQSVDFCATAELHGVNLRRARTLYSPFEVRLELLYHP